MGKLEVAELQREIQVTRRILPTMPVEQVEARLAELDFLPLEGFLKGFQRTFQSI